MFACVFVLALSDKGRSTRSCRMRAHTACVHYKLLILSRHGDDNDGDGDDVVNDVARMFAFPCAISFGRGGGRPLYTRTCMCVCVFHAKTLTYTHTQTHTAHTNSGTK